MANVAQQVRGANAIFQGFAYPGIAERYIPPRCQVDIEPYRAFGMDADILIDKGMQALMAQLVLNGYHRDALVQFGLKNGSQVTLEVRASLEDLDGTDGTVVFTHAGQVIDLQFSPIMGRPDVPRVGFSLACTYFSVALTPNLGTPAIEIDVQNFTRKIDGDDRLQPIRGFLGLA